MSGVADRVFIFLSHQKNLCLCNHPTMFLGSHLAGIGNQSLLLADFNVSFRVKFWRYHATAKCLYQGATIPDVNMHYFLLFSCFMEELFPQAFILHSYFCATLLVQRWLCDRSHWGQVQDYLKTHSSLASNFIRVAPFLLTHCTQGHAKATWSLCAAEFQIY